MDMLWLFLVDILNSKCITSDYVIQRPIGTNQDFYHGTQRVLPEAPTLEELANRVIDSRAKIVGISAKTCYAHHAGDLARKIKERDSRIKVVLGGYHPSGYPEMLNDYHRAIDFVVLGAGEKVFGNLCEDILQGKNPVQGRPTRAIPKIADPERRKTLAKGAIAYSCREGLVQAERTERDFFKSVDEIPIPKRKREYREGCCSQEYCPEQSPLTRSQQQYNQQEDAREIAAITKQAIYMELEGKRLATGCNKRSIENVVTELQDLSSMGRAEVCLLRSSRSTRFRTTGSFRAWPQWSITAGPARRAQPLEPVNPPSSRLSSPTSSRHTAPQRTWSGSGPAAASQRHRRCACCGDQDGASRRRDARARRSDGLDRTR